MHWNWILFPMILSQVVADKDCADQGFLDLWEFIEHFGRVKDVENRLCIHTKEYIEQVYHIMDLEFFNNPTSQTSW